MFIVLFMHGAHVTRAVISHTSLSLQRPYRIHRVFRTDSIVLQESPRVDILAATRIGTLSRAAEVLRLVLLNLMRNRVLDCPLGCTVQHTLVLVAMLVTMWFTHRLADHGCNWVRSVLRSSFLMQHLFMSRHEYL